MNDLEIPPIDDEAAWQSFQSMWTIRTETVYLNHGSFGPPPESVRNSRHQWQRRLDGQPMDFFFREFEPAWRHARQELAVFVGVAAEDLVFVENATVGMNLVANNWKLKPGDEVVLNDHEYGAVQRIWQRACERSGATSPVIARLPDRIESEQQVIDSIFAVVTPRTRMLVVSHITSPSALIMPVKKICTEAQARGIAVCVDGPHAPAQVPVDIRAIGCDFYAASCHKWLCAPFGSGFLSVAKSHQETFRPSMLSWGRLLPASPDAWWEEFIWTGTRDPSAYFATTAAIQFLRQVGFERFRKRTHALAQYARERISEVAGLESSIPDSPAWYGSMVLAPLPPVDARRLQADLWGQYQIEVPIIDLPTGAPERRQFVRVSCHLYNTPKQINRLVAALAALM